MTLAIAHHQGEHSVLDLLRACKPPFSPERVTEEFAQDLRRYSIHEIHGDKYAGEWPAEQFQKHMIRYRPSERTKSEIYQAHLPQLNSGRVELLDNKTLRQQLIGLERRTARGGKDSIDHRPGAHDDVVNSAAEVLVQCTPAVQITASHFAQGAFSYFGKPSDERTLWNQREQ
jgi:hypothetical protein